MFREKHNNILTFSTFQRSSDNVKPDSASDEGVLTETKSNMVEVPPDSIPFNFVAFSLKG